MPSSSAPASELIALLDACAARGIALEAGPDGTLKLRAPAGALTPDLQAQLKTYKPALITLLAVRNAGATSTAPIPRRTSTGPAPLSSAQARLWFLTQLDPASNAAYNIVAAVRIRGPLDPNALERAVNALAARHDSLRTCFIAAAGQPEQHVAAAVTVPMTRLDLRSLTDATAREAAVAERLRAEAAQPFDLTRAPLLRTTLLALPDDESVFIFSLHHLVSDGWSSGVIVRDLAALYTAETTGRATNLPELAIQFADYVAWQAERLAAPAAARSLEFWKTALVDTPVLNLATDHPRPPAMSYRGATDYFTFPPDLSRALNDLARREGATLFQVLLAGWNALLVRYTGQTDFAVGTSIANRAHPSLEPLIGFLTNTLALRTPCGGNPTFTELVARTRAVASAAYEHAETPLERIIEAVQPDRTMSQNPLFQVVFSLLQAHRDALQLGDGLTLEQLNVPSATARFDLTVTVEDTRAGLLVAVEYSRDLFEPPTIARMMLHYRTLLTAAAAAPQTRLAALPLLSAEERHTLLHDWNATTTAYPKTKCVHELFEACAAATPHAPAVTAGDRTLTYAELNAAANRLARRLRTQGVAADVGVAVCAERTLEMVVTLVAVLKAGGYYLPFDPADPAERLNFLFEQARVRLIAAPRDAAPRLPASRVPFFPVQLDAPDLLAESPENLPNIANPDNLAYTTFTSGSTGRPKGICIPHRGVVRLVRDTNYLRYGPDLRILELAPVSFDASTFELWGALCNGALLVVLRAGAPSIRELREEIQRHRITSLYLTSALFNLMVDERVEAFRGVQHLLVGGDIISVPHARKVLAAHPGLTLINGYGPTETTTFASCGLVRTPEEVGYTVTIGPPISNTTAYILDREMEPVPVGVPGDLYLGGDGNARGYLQLPALTAETFIPNPHATTPGERIYKTGDLARWMPDGTIEFLGRRDFQVKVRGFRIELGEIESCLASHPAVKETLILVHEIRPGDKRLIAYVQPRAGFTTPDEETLRAHVRAHLPDFMVPAAFVIVPEFPLTPHNKIDRAALRALGAGATSTKAAHIPPRTPVEETIAAFWREVLKVDRVGAQDNFFDLGGHSLLATQVMWRVFEVFRLELPLRTLFEASTVTAFAAALTAAVDQSTSQPGRAEKIARLHLRVSRMSPEEVQRTLAAKRTATA
jgi:amino acid adenylation domain-containing protein